MELIDFAEAFDEVEEEFDLLIEVQLAGEGKILEGNLHTWNCGQISHDFLAGSDQDFLRKLFIFMHVVHKGKEGVIVEDPHIIGLVLLENVAQIDVE
jgi:hypothetical protein